MQPQLVRASNLEERGWTSEEVWKLSTLSGRLTELSGSDASACLTMSSVFIRQSQEAGELAVWITAANSIFFPPDMETAGVDLAALPVVWARNATNAAEAAELLLRSNGFALVIIDLGETKYLKDAALGRLLRLAGHFQSAVLCITHKPQSYASLGSMVALRLHAVRRRAFSGNYSCGIHVLKDKRNGPVGSYWEERYAPAGLR